jgi:hypothetical protein
MLFREIVTVYCDNNIEHANTLRGQNSESQYVNNKLTTHFRDQGNVHLCIHTSIRLHGVVLS